MTFEPMREALAARCAQEGWARRDQVDPHSWPQAVRHRLLWQVVISPFRSFESPLGMIVFITLGYEGIRFLLGHPPGWARVLWGCVFLLYGALVIAFVVRVMRWMIRLRRVADQGLVVSARYLLARHRTDEEHLDDDYLILFPLVGDVGPSGVIALELAAAGTIPLAGTIELAAGPTDPTTALPVDGALLVPKFDSRPIWPGGAFQVLPADQLNALVTGRGRVGDDRQRQQ